MNQDSAVVTEEERRVENEDFLQVVTFKIGDEEFAIEVLKVQEIIRPVEVTRVPRCPDFIEGVVNLRGKVIPVINLRKRFGHAVIEQGDESRVIVVGVGDSRSAGLVVDSVSEILRLSPDTIEPPPPAVGSVQSKYILGMGKLEDRLIILLALDNVLTTEENKALELF